MSNDSPPFPPDGKYLDAIRDSCRAVREASDITINRSEIERLLLSPAFVDSFQRVSKAHGLAFPLQFPSEIAELNLLATLSLLNFASGYRVLLHEETGRGAWDNIRALVFSLYITSSSDVDWLSAKGMQSINEQTVAEQLQVSILTERPHESIPGVTIGELGGPMYNLVHLITRTLRETGNILVKTSYPNLGTFILEALRNGKSASKGQSPDLDVVLDQIVRAIPAFRDMALVDGQPVYCFKKALFLLHAIRIRFGGSNSTSVPVPDTSSLPVFSDNVLPSMLVHLGVINLASSLTLSSRFPDHSSDLPKLLAKSEMVSEKEVIAKLPREPPTNGPILDNRESYILRASAIDACSMIVEVAHSLNSPELPPEVVSWMKSITLPDLDMWLWAVAKDRPDYRSLERFVVKDTVMF